MSSCTGNIQTQVIHIWYTKVYLLVCGNFMGLRVVAACSSESLLEAGMLLTHIRHLFPPVLVPASSVICVPALESHSSTVFFSVSLIFTLFLEILLQDRKYC